MNEATQNLTDWHWNEDYHCWCLEQVCYAANPTVPQVQRLNIFVPGAYRNADGSWNKNVQISGYNVNTAPVVFENNAAGYVEMPAVNLGEERCYARPYLEHGLIYISCGCRGRDSKDANGRLVGKAPINLIDFKVALRFLRHHAEELPGDFDHIISVGWSAGGAMSSLLALTGDHPLYEPYLQAEHAYLEESDAVYAAQMYCPIVDLDHVDIAYEWNFFADKTCETSHAGPAETMSPFKEAFSKACFDRYVTYFNELGLRHPQTGGPLHLESDGRSGSGYEYLMTCLEDAATYFLQKLAAGEQPLGIQATPEQYLSGDYQQPKVDRKPGFNEGEYILVPGTDKREWLSWDGKRAKIKDLDTYILNHRRRMKPCTSFDIFSGLCGENQLFGSPEEDFKHFAPDLPDIWEQLKDDWKEEYDRCHGAYENVRHDTAQAMQRFLINPMNFVGTKEQEHSHQAEHYRIRVGARDADTAWSTSMSLAVKLANAECGTVDYALVWDAPHSEADYEGEMLRWIDEVCK